MNLRVRGPSGQATISGVEPTWTVAQLLSALAEKTGVSPSQQEIMAGFPPKAVALPADPEAATVASLGLPPGEALTVRELPSNGSAGAGAAPGALDTTGMSEDEQLARAIALSMGQDLPVAPAPAAAPPQRQASPVRSHPAAAPAPGAKGTPVSAPMAGGGAMVRRIIDSDNSCLFNAVGYVMERSRAAAPRLRGVIASAVLADPFEFNEAVLGKEPAEYCAWIREPSKWGGAIELSILAKHFGREIAAFDIQTCRCDVYGQGAGYSERAFLIYDGLHYDAMAVAAYDGAPESKDLTILPTGSLRLEQAMEGATRLVAAAHAARQFTDTANFTLRCGMCQIGLRGEKEAVEHAKTTGHTNFSEY